MSPREVKFQLLGIFFRHRFDGFGRGLGLKGRRDKQDIIHLQNTSIETGAIAPKLARVNILKNNYENNYLILIIFSQDVPNGGEKKWMIGFKNPLPMVFIKMTFDVFFCLAIYLL